MRSYRNKHGGTGVVELGPAMFIILIIVLIPCLDFMQIGLAYACGWYANHLATREAACAGPTNAQVAADAATNAWLVSGLGAFTRASNVANSVVPFPPGNPDFIQVTTSLKVEPMFKLPFVANQSVPFTFVGVRPLEEKDLH